MEYENFYEKNKHIFYLDTNKDKICQTYFAVIIQEVKKFSYTINNQTIKEYRSSFFFPDFPMLAGCVDSIKDPKITNACCILLQNHITKLHKDKEVLPKPMAFDEIVEKYFLNDNDDVYRLIEKYHITVVENKDGKDELMVVPDNFTHSFYKIIDNFVEKL